MRDTSEQEKRAHLRKIINHARTGMFVTRTDEGGLHGRPMAHAHVEEGFERVWFATSASSPKVEELKADDHAFVGYTNTDGSEWASLSGHARILKESARAHELWSPFWKNWFSGPDDPDLIILEFVPDAAEYWDSGNKIIAMAKFAVGAMVGKNLLAEDHERMVMR